QVNIRHVEARFTQPAAHVPANHIGCTHPLVLFLKIPQDLRMLPIRNSRLNLTWGESEPQSGTGIGGCKIVGDSLMHDQPQDRDILKCCVVGTAIAACILATVFAPLNVASDMRSGKLSRDVHAVDPQPDSQMPPTILVGFEGPGAALVSQLEESRDPRPPRFFSVERARFPLRKHVPKLKRPTPF